MQEKTKQKVKIYLAVPRGFCSGVKNAIGIVENLIKKGINPIYVKHEIVHNKHVVENFKKRGVIFVENLKDIPPGSNIVFNAHGVSASVEQEAQRAGLKITDASCPIVKKIHKFAEDYSSKGYTIILIGTPTHPEIIGTAGRIKGRYYVIQKVSDIRKIKVVNSDEKFLCLTQTTLNPDECKKIYTALKRKLKFQLKNLKDNICYATRERQEAVKRLAKKTDLIFIIGSANSSNSKRLTEIARKCGVKAYLIEDSTKIKKRLLKNVKAIGISSGASAPEYLVQDCVKRIRNMLKIY